MMKPLPVRSGRAVLIARMVSLTLGGRPIRTNSEKRLKARDRFCLPIAWVPTERKHL